MEVYDVDFWSELLMRLHKNGIPSFRSHNLSQVQAEGESKLDILTDPEQSIKEAQTPVRPRYPVKLSDKPLSPD